jgi:predicted Zn-dependent protease
LYFSLGAYGACISEGLEILKSKPDSVPALGLLSRASILAGDYPGATTFLERLRGAQPDPSSATAYQLGLCLLAQNKREEALRELRASGASTRRAGGDCCRRAIFGRLDESARL